MARMMRDRAFTENMRAGVYDEHVAPVNRLVDQL